MARILVAEFDSRDQASLAVQKLIDTGVPKGHIDSYPSLDEHTPREPDKSERVKGAETPVSSNGPLGHLQAVIAKVFGVGKPDDPALSSSEPTAELTGKSPAFLSVHMDGIESRLTQLGSLLTDAGALRVAEHEM